MKQSQKDYSVNLIFSHFEIRVSQYGRWINLLYFKFSIPDVSMLKYHHQGNDQKSKTKLNLFRYLTVSET